MELTAANLDLLYRQVDTRYQGALIGTPTYYQDIASVIPVGTEQITMAWLDRIPLMRKWHGPRVINSAVARSRTINMEPWEDTVGLDLFQLSDENMTVFGNTVAGLGEATAKWQDQMLSLFLSTQANTALGYDGVPVYSTAHPLLGGVSGGIPTGAPSTQSNLATSTALTYDNYIAAWQNMASWVGPDGAPMASIPDTLMVSPQKAGVAKLILESDFLAAGALTSTSNASQSNTWKGSTKLIINPYLASMPNNWFLLNTSGSVKPYAIFERLAPQMTALTSPTDANVFMNHQLLWGSAARGNSSETVWWLSYAATSEAQYYHIA
jgi:phage major head subunit gpT-like protein